MDPLPALRADARAIYSAALAAVEPGRAVRRALAEVPSADRTWLIALGKAAVPMAAATVADLGDRLAGGLMVTTEPGVPIDGRLHRYHGEHPEPGLGSCAAADALGALLRRVQPTDLVLVLLSGGTTSLIGAPAPGVSADDYAAVFAAAWRAGLPIGAMNRIRKRFSRWGAGRLAAALPTQSIEVLAVSDVPNDEVAAIGSGPCSPDPTPAEEVLAALGSLPLTVATRGNLERWLSSSEAKPPYPDGGGLGRVRTRVIASNRIAVDAAAAAARHLGYQVTRLAEPITGEARLEGERLANRVRQLGHRAALIAGGETTVALGADVGTGGRCQEFTLAASQRLAGSSPGAVLLVASTDGRDGPTDAAGAIVDHHTWPAIQATGIDPTTALNRHDAHPALAKVDALITAGPTGTNVADLFIALTPAPHEPDPRLLPDTLPPSRHPAIPPSRHPAIPPYNGNLSFGNR